MCDYASNFYGNEEECAQEFNALVHQEMDPIEEGWESIADPQSVYEEECGNLIAEGNYANPDIYREGAGIAAERFCETQGAIVERLLMAL